MNIQPKHVYTKNDDDRYIVRGLTKALSGVWVVNVLLLRVVVSYLEYIIIVLLILRCYVRYVTR